MIFKDREAVVDMLSQYQEINAEKARGRRESQAYAKVIRSERHYGNRRCIVKSSSDLVDGVKRTLGAFPYALVEARRSSFELYDKKTHGQIQSI